MFGGGGRRGDFQLYPTPPPPFCCMQVVVSAVLEGDAAPGSSIGMYLKAEQPAGWGPGQHDLRPSWDAATEGAAAQVVLQPSLTQWRVGAWYVGVVGRDAPVAFTLSISKNECPGNCSAHGTCDTISTEPLQRQCKCAEGYTGADCSKVLRALEYGDTVVQQAGAFEYHFFSLPQPTGAPRAQQGPHHLSCLGS